MKGFTTPRLLAANLTLFFRALAIDRMRRTADSIASSQAGLDRDQALRDRIRRADTNASFWILHAR
jgi:hypothetical protein